MAGGGVVWEHTDSDGDRIELIPPDSSGLALMSINGHPGVLIPEEELFRLRDVIEKISTS